MKVLITRPLVESIELTKSLKSVGIMAWSFPILEFIPGSGLYLLKKEFQLIKKNDYVFITSKKSIEYASIYLKKNQIQWPSCVKYYTIGEGTSKILKQNSGFNSKHPTGKETSEKLLKIINLKKIKNKTIFILKGNKGRKLLEKTFIKKGAKVIIIECYKRKTKNINSKLETIKWKKKKLIH